MAKEKQEAKSEETIKTQTVQKVDTAKRDRILADVSGNPRKAEQAKVRLNKIKGGKL
ncbi:hypothetical protein [Enterococcus avium]|uniref:hypothetical protein n=1 Tax=Enterococcus avium TaxID=33945 RepID=UPI001F58F36C|nr:hypothetical protein [Enterococcus avium]